MTKYIYKLEKSNSSDDTAILVEIIKADGSFVSKGELLGVVETSKASIELEAKLEGYLFWFRAESDEISVGDSVFAITKSAEKPDNLVKDTFENDMPSSNEVSITGPAQKLMSLHKLNLEQLSPANKQIITKQDVEFFIKSSATSIVTLETKIDQRSVVIYGIGSQADVVFDALISDELKSVVAFVDFAGHGGVKNNLPIISHEEFMYLLEKHALLVHICLPDANLEKDLIKLVIDSKSELVSVFDASSRISKLSSIGHNVFVGANCTVGPYSQLENAVRLLNNSSVAHHSFIGQQTWICDGARIGGNVRIGQQCLVGLNASVNKKVKVGDHSTIISNTAVMFDVDENSTVGKMNS